MLGGVCVVIVIILIVVGVATGILKSSPDAGVTRTAETRRCTSGWNIQSVRYEVTGSPRGWVVMYGRQSANLWDNVLGGNKGGVVTDNDWNGLAISPSGYGSSYAGFAAPSGYFMDHVMSCFARDGMSISSTVFVIGSDQRDESLYQQRQWITTPEPASRMRGLLLWNPDTSLFSNQNYNSMGNIQARTSIVWRRSYFSGIRSTLAEAMRDATDYVTDGSITQFRNQLRALLARV